MSSPEAIDVLNRVLTILRRSFPQYLRYARPYVRSGDDRALAVIHQIVTGQDALADRIGRWIVAAGTRPEAGHFPMEFTNTHDLGIDHLIREAVGYQQQDVAALEACADSLSRVSAAGGLVAEALGMAKGHLDRLEELVAEKKTAKSCQ